VPNHSKADTGWCVRCTCSQCQHCQDNTAVLESDIPTSYLLLQTQRQHQLWLLSNRISLDMCHMLTNSASKWSAQSGLRLCQYYEILFIDFSKTCLKLVALEQSGKHHSTAYLSKCWSMKVRSKRQCDASNLWALSPRNENMSEN